MNMTWNFSRKENYVVSETLPTSIMQKESPRATGTSKENKTSQWGSGGLLGVPHTWS